jgi:hypothetical protein
VDRAAGQVGVALKDGAGPPDVTETFRDLAERMAQMGDAAAAIALLDQERDAIRQQVRDEAAAN